MSKAPDKVHVLEGTEGGFNARKIFRCGRRTRLDRGYVGCALLKERGHEITCAVCIAVTKKRYGTTLGMVVRGNDTKGATK